MIGLVRARRARRTLFIDVPRLLAIFAKFLKAVRCNMAMFFTAIVLCGTHVPTFPFSLVMGSISN